MKKSLKKSTISFDNLFVMRIVEIEINKSANEAHAGLLLNKSLRHMKKGILQ